MSRKNTAAKGVPAIRTRALGDGWKTLESMYGLGKSILRRIGEVEALKQGAVSAAVDVLSQDTAKARFRMVQRNERGTRLLSAGEHPLARRLMLDPNRHQTWHEAMEMLIRHLGVHQNSYLVKIDRQQNDPDPDLVPVHPGRVTQHATDGRFFYDVTPMSQAEATLLGFSETRRFSDSEIIHIRGRMHTGEIGLSTLILASDVLGLNQALIEFQTGLINTGLRPNAVIATDNELTDDQFTRLKREIEAMLADVNSRGAPALFEAGLKYSPISRNATEDTDLHKARQLLRQEVAALWRIPAYKIGAGETEKYNNKSAAEQTYVDDALVPVALRVEACLERAFLTDSERLRGLTFSFNRDDLYDRDRQMASDRVVKQYTEGVITRGQALQKLGYDSVPSHLDTYRIPVNAAILHLNGDIEYVTPTGPEDPPDEAKDDTDEETPDTPDDAEKSASRLHS